MRLATASLLSLTILSLPATCLAATPRIPKAMTVLSHVDDTAEGQRALGANGHAIDFQRTKGVQFVEAV